MADAALLLRYRETRTNLLLTCGYNSTGDKTERQAAVRRHLESLGLVEARFPGIKFVHSLAEYCLQQAIDQQP